jgi:hypothetical protein
MGGLAGLDRAAGLLGGWVQFWVATDEPLHHAHRRLQVRNLLPIYVNSAVQADQGRFPFPLAGTYIQLIITHILLIGFSSLTRALDRPFRWLGLGPAVAPAFPVAPQGGAYRGSNKKHVLRSIGRWLSHGSGGIAGGGLFEFDVQIARKVLPLAVIFVVKIVLSNFSFA